MAELIGNGLVIYTFMISLAFCVAYHFAARWWETEFGRSLMIYQVAMTLVLGLTLPRLLVGGDNLIFQYVRIAVFAVVPLALTWRLIVLIKVQRRANRDGADHPPE